MSPPSSSSTFSSSSSSFLRLPAELRQTCLLHALPRRPFELFPDLSGECEAGWDLDLDQEQELDLDIGLGITPAPSSRVDADADADADTGLGTVHPLVRSDLAATKRHLARWTLEHRERSNVELAGWLLGQPRRKLAEVRRLDVRFCEHLEDAGRSGDAPPSPEDESDEIDDEHSDEQPDEQPHESNLMILGPDDIWDTGAGKVDAESESESESKRDGPDERHRHHHHRRRRRYDTAGLLGRAAGFLFLALSNLPELRKLAVTLTVYTEPGTRMADAQLAEAKEALVAAAAHATQGGVLRARDVAVDVCHEYRRGVPALARDFERWT